MARRRHAGVKKDELGLSWRGLPAAHIVGPLFGLPFLGKPQESLQP